MDSCQYYNLYYAMDDNEIPYENLTFQYLPGKISLSASKYISSKYPILIHKNKDENSQNTNSGGVNSKGTNSGGNNSQETTFFVSDMIMPLYSRMNMLSSDAREIFYVFLSGSCGITEYIQKFKSKIAQNFFQKVNTIPGSDIGKPVITRIFLASSRSFKQKRVNKFSIGCNMEQYANVYASIPMPKFIWVCELYADFSSYTEGRSMGEIILDATSIGTDMERSIILIHYPNLIIYRMPDEPYDPCMWQEKIISSRKYEKWNFFERFDFGHVFSI